MLMSIPPPAKLVKYFFKKKDLENPEAFFSFLFDIGAIIYKRFFSWI